MSTTHNAKGISFDVSDTDFSPSYYGEIPDAAAYSPCECGNTVFVSASVRVEYRAWPRSNDGTPWRQPGQKLAWWTSTGVYRCTACNRLLTEPADGSLYRFGL